MEKKPTPDLKDINTEQELSEQPELSVKVVAEEMQKLKQTLNETLNSFNERKAKTELFNQTILELKNVTNAITSSLTKTESPASSNKNCCQNGPCDCVNDQCCCFEIVLKQVRASKPQIEPPDMGDIPTLINAMEVQIYVTVDNQGFLWPGLATTMDLRADGMPGGPGPWVIIERVVNKVFVKKGTSMTTSLYAQVREHDEGVERPIAFKDEIGDSVGTITLDCCMDKIFPPEPIEVSLNQGGEGRGMVQLSWYARRVCC